MAKASGPRWRAGYYRTNFMWATGMSNVRAFFAQLYGNTNLDSDPASAGRQMATTSRPGSSTIAATTIIDTPNSTADVSNWRWMPRFARARLCVKAVPEQTHSSAPHRTASRSTQRVVRTIGTRPRAKAISGDVQRGGVLQVPIALSVWDDGYAFGADQPRPRRARSPMRFELHSTTAPRDIYVIPAGLRRPRRRLRDRR